MQFQVIAYDGKDENAMQRRLAVREAHLAGVTKLKQEDHLIAGGAILDEKNNMIGSTLYAEFESREELDRWLQADPYVTGDVWRDITVIPIRLAIR